MSWVLRGYVRYYLISYVGFCTIIHPCVQSFVLNVQGPFRVIFLHPILMQNNVTSSAVSWYRFPRFPNETNPIPQKCTKDFPEAPVFHNATVIFKCSSQCKSNIVNHETKRHPVNPTPRPLNSKAITPYRPDKYCPPSSSLSICWRYH